MKIGCSQLFKMATHAYSSQTKFKPMWWLPGKRHASLAKFVHFFWHRALVKNGSKWLFGRLLTAWVAVQTTIFLPEFLCVAQCNHRLRNSSVGEFVVIQKAFILLKKEKRVSVNVYSHGILHLSKQPIRCFPSTSLSFSPNANCLHDLTLRSLRS